MISDWFRRPLVWICLILTSSALLIGAEKVDVRVVQGVGMSRSDAVINGLIEAIRQIEGVSVDSTQELQTSFRQVFAEKDGEQSQNTSMTEDQKRAILTKAKGYIRSYKVLSAERLEDNTGWQASIRVEIPKYETPGISPKSRRRLAIVPVRSSRDTFVIFDQSMSGEVVAHKLTQNLVNQFTQSRRFTVLDRETVSSYAKEKQLILSGDAPIEEQLKLGQVLGVDYLVMVEISELEGHQVPFEIGLTGESGVDLRGSISLNFKIAVMATRQIKWSDTLSLAFDNDELLKLAPADTIDSLVNGMLNAAADAIATESLDNIYPLRVVALSGGESLILNEGGIRLNKGDLLDVFSEGKEVHDPYTKESLGSVETWVAQVEIVNVLPKMSEARVIKGDPGKITVGCVLRSSQSGDMKEPMPQQKTRQGVRLPFD